MTEYGVGQSLICTNRCLDNTMQRIIKPENVNQLDGCLCALTWCTNPMDRDTGGTPTHGIGNGNA